MDNHMAPGNKLYHEGLFKYESYLTNNTLSESELGRTLEESIDLLQRALNAQLDATTEVQCRRALGVALFELNEGLLDFVVKSGLSEYQGLNKAVAELETALKLDGQRGTRVFFDRSPQSSALLRLDAAWQRQSLYLKNQFGPEKKLSYLQEKLNVLDYLGGVRPPGLCLSLAFHYRDVGNRPLTLEWLKNAAAADDYGDLDNKSIFYEIAQDNKRRAKKGVDEMSSPKRSSPAPDQQKKSGGGCFIATAVYGSPIAPEVLVLRRFRDEVLLRSRPGKHAVRLYYAVSPFIASFIEEKKPLKAVVRTLLAPVLCLVRTRTHRQ